MKLRHKHPRPPPRHTTPQSPPQERPKHQQTDGIPDAQHGPDHQLRMLEPDDADDGLAQPREQHGAGEGPGYGTREGEVVVGGGDAARGVGAVTAEEREAVDEDVVRRLQVE